MNTAFLKLLKFLGFVVLAIALGALCFWGIGYLGAPDILFKIGVVAIVFGVAGAIIYAGYVVYGGGPNA